MKLNDANAMSSRSLIGWCCVTLGATRGPSMPLEPEPDAESTPSPPTDPPGSPEPQETPKAPKTLWTSKSKAKMVEGD